MMHTHTLVPSMRRKLLAALLAACAGVAVAAPPAADLSPRSDLGRADISMGNTPAAPVVQGSAAANKGASLRGAGNTSSATQRGEGNKADLRQSGHGNEITLSQTGNDNQASIALTGNNGRAAVAQTGNANTVEIELNGNNRAIQIEQTGNSRIDKVIVH
jgi:minor curlin subunit